MNAGGDQSTYLDRLQLPDGADPALEPYIANIRQQVQPFKGEYRADWLLVDFKEPVWKTRTKISWRMDGEWYDTLDVSWDAKLPDGCQLTHPKYQKLLDACCRASFLFRQGLAGDRPALKSWCDFNDFLLRLCQWVVLESPRYRPAKEAFSMLDNGAVWRLVLALGRGGWFEALNVAERVLMAIHTEVFGSPCPAELLESPGDWPKPVRDKVTQWLEAHHGYSIYSGKSSGLVSRTWLGYLVGASPETLGASPYINVVLRQFEPQWQHPHLLLSANCRTEYPSHRTPLLQEVLEARGSESVVNGAMVDLATLLKLSRHLPDVLPDPTGIQLKEAQQAANRLTKPSGRTPFIPIDTGFRYMNEALRWVLLYGDALVDLYLAVYAKLAAMRKSSGKISHPHQVEKEIIQKTFQSEVLLAAGFEFKRFVERKDRSFEQRRAAPTLHEALEIWLGAVTVLLSFLKPSRESEILTLPRVCLLRTRGGHYWIDSDLAKRTKSEVRARTGGKPIPLIAAQAIQQVRKLNRGLVSINGEKNAHMRDRLFYLPNPQRWGSGKKMNPNALYKYINKFCDNVNLPPDDFGRRWYLRIHEMRKWFLLLLFWSGRYDVLDATRWVAGHTDVEHIYAYIEREFPGDTLGELEAECAIDLLSKYDESQVVMDDGPVGLDELYLRVLQHFNVKRLNLVKEREWQSLVQELFEQEYHLEPLTLSTEDNQKSVCIAIRQGSREEA